MAKEEDLIYKLNLEKRLANVCKSTYNRTINFNNGMTAAEMQTQIDALHRHIPNYHVVYFQFADGAYNMTAGLTFEGFYGGGSIFIQGNAGDGTSQSTSQSVFLDFSGQDCTGVLITGCHCRFAYVRNFKIRIKSTTATNYCLQSTFNSCLTNFFYNYAYGTGTTYGCGFEAYSCKAYLYRNYFGDTNIAIRSREIGHIYSRENDDIGTMPIYGLYATGASLIGKRSSQPDGSSLDEYPLYGSVIR